jgi:hypothetical protein
MYVMMEVFLSFALFFYVSKKLKLDPMTMVMILLKKKIVCMWERQNMVNVDTSETNAFLFCYDTFNATI